MRFEILGELRVLRDGEPIDPGPAKQRGVLAVLLLHAGRAVPTNQIVDAVWGDEPPENGPNVVQKHIAGLRRALDPDRAPRTPSELITLTSAGYVLRLDGHTLDADEFAAAVSRASTAEAVRAALTLWRGEALAGLTGPFFDAARARLAERHATAWERWAELESWRGRDAALVPELARLVEQFPLREGLRAHLMIALSRSGRQAEALAAFQSARSYLVAEFGTEPGGQLQEAHRRILRGESTLANLPPVIAQAYEPVASTPAAPARLRVPYGEILIAIGVPLLTFTTGAWVYVVFAAVRHHNRKLLLAAVFYAGLVATWITCMIIDPTPLDDSDTPASDVVGMLAIFATVFLSTIHGAIVATHQAGVTALTAALSARGGGQLAAGDILDKLD